MIDQLALLSRNGDYYKVLHAGEHLLPWLNTPEVLLITLDGSEVPDVLADYLRRFQPDWVEKYCLVADLSEIEAGALYMDGILQEILPPSTRRLYWRVEDDLTLVRMNTQQVQVQTEVMNAVLQPRRKGAVKGRDAILTVQVPAWDLYGIPSSNAVDGLTVRDLLHKYLNDPNAGGKAGRTKRYVLELLMDSDISAIKLSELTENDVIEHCRLRNNAGAGPATVSHDVSYLGSVLDAAKPVYGINYTSNPAKSARPYLLKLGLIGKSNRRNRRPASDELDMLIEGLQQRSISPPLPAKAMKRSLPSAISH